MLNCDTWTENSAANVYNEHELFLLSSELRVWLIIVSTEGSLTVSKNARGKMVE